MIIRCINKNIADLTFGKVYSVIDKIMNKLLILEHTINDIS